MKNSAIKCVVGLSLALAGCGDGGSEDGTQSTGVDTGISGETGTPTAEAGNSDSDTNPSTDTNTEDSARTDPSASDSDSA